MERARHNASLNGIGNAEFHVADLGKALDPSLPWLKESYTSCAPGPATRGRQ